MTGMAKQEITLLAKRLDLLRSRLDELWDSTTDADGVAAVQAVYVGSIGVVIWPVSLGVIVATNGGGDRVIRTLLVDPHWKPWLLAIYAGGWVGSIVLLVSGRAFRRGRRAGRHG